MKFYYDKLSAKYQAKVGIEIKYSEPCNAKWFMVWLWWWRLTWEWHPPKKRNDYVS